MTFKMRMTMARPIVMLFMMIGVRRMSMTISEHGPSLAESCNTPQKAWLSTSKPTTSPITVTKVSLKRHRAGGCMQTEVLE